MLSGELDPVTPPRWAKAAAERLPHAVVLTFPSIGHGVLGADECASLVIGRFLGDPAKPPFDPCLLALRPPQFARP
jgi:pimeloyl-ACP methyl ester carboxylesterase